jgi:hypothetical protein
MQMAYLAGTKIYCMSASILRVVSGLVLIFGHSFLYGQDVNVPSQLDIPKGSQLILHAYARGVQVYTCTPMTTDSTKYEWMFTEARATLYTGKDYLKTAGKHYFNAAHHPVWEGTDGTTVEGSKLQQAAAPDPVAIPWLLLQVLSGTGSGPLRKTAFIQRIHTSGGKAPAGGADRSHRGQTIQVDYTADYLFYGGK